MTASSPTATRFGVACSVIASALFALMYYQAALLAPLGSAAIYGWRILLTTPFLGAFLLLSRRWDEVATIGRRLRARPSLGLVLLLSSALLGVQLWLFMWAPIHGHGLDVSLGYFLLPLTLVLTGRLCFGERISRLQLVACALAAVGVVNELLFAPRVSWPAFVVAFGYPCYFALRRVLRTNHLGGMWFDMAFSLPVGLWFIAAPLPEGVHAMRHPVLGILVLGMLSAVALAFMIAASQRLTLGLFGLLSYVEPALLVAVSLLLGERISQSQWLTYGSIWAAILLLVFEGAVAMRAVRPRDLPA
ncbi:EamA family transporter RarD [Hydrogenophaga laconesensis]|uniref:Chloramphenicol-sensitive protein RarD n=1 Tax=Hydrogenophaga laconesensis TaxID=1805971 RepID=A0ABU1V9I7_9BURK|nr:EamA family transporter RarD [Hydrogenophaga laconesensis]MDR7093883.1 chloramphenicol-sensitive protein RarD [Hydrogenophaga laconesensis]